MVVVIISLFAMTPDNKVKPSIQEEKRLKGLKIPFAN